MSQIKVQEFAGEIKKCLKECEEAIKSVLETYKKTKSGVESMSPEEEKAFLKEAFVFLYDSADKSFEMPDIVDAVVKSIAIPQGVELLFKKVS